MMFVFFNTFDKVNIKELIKNKMKFKVTDDCTNCSYCYTQYPDKFEISEDGSKSVPIDGIDIDEDEANEIANECPMMAIKVIK